MRLWAIALIVGVGCASAERRDTAHADLARGEEAPAPEAAAQPRPEPEYEWQDADGDGIAELPRAGDPPQTLEPFDLTAAAAQYNVGSALRYHLKHCVRRVVVGVPDKRNECLQAPFVVNACAVRVSNGLETCFKRDEDGSLALTPGWPPSGDGWGKCSGADELMAYWPACAASHANPTGPRPERTPFDANAAALRARLGCWPPRFASLPQEAKGCLQPLDLGCATAVTSTGSPICMKRIDDGALSTTPIPLATREEWTSCDEADGEKVKWPTCHD